MNGSIFEAFSSSNKRLKTDHNLHLYPVISCLTAVISVPVSLWLRRGGFFSPLTMLALLALALALALELSKPTPLPGNKPIGDAPNTGCGPDAEPGQSEFREFERSDGEVAWPTYLGSVGGLTGAL